MSENTISGNYSELLDTCLELEGLLMLAVNRPDNLPDNVRELIRGKIGILNSAFDSDKNDNCDTCSASLEQVADSVEYEETNDAEPCTADDAKEIEVAPVAEEPAKTEEPSKKEPPVLSQEKHSEHSFKFALNDKYRFIRELFEGNESEFNDALNAVAEIKDMNDIEDYLYNDLCFDEQNATVKEFVGIIRNSLSTDAADR